MYFPTMILLFILGVRSLSTTTLDANSTTPKMKPKQRQPRIAFGVPSTIEQYPYMVALIAQNGASENFCGGSILSSYIILTAAHCFSNKFNDTKFWQVRAGSTFYMQDGSSHKIRNYSVHPEFNNNSRHFDVAVVQLKTPIEIDKKTKKSITMFRPDEKINVGDKATAVGWGSHRPNSINAPWLQSVEMKVVTRKKCSEVYEKPIREGKIPKVFTIFRDHICVSSCADKPYESTCHGDSGGPLIINNKLAGVLSFGVPCKSMPFPNVFIGIPYVRQWIDQKVNQYEDESFDPKVEAGILRRAMKGAGTDEESIISVLAGRTHKQRFEIGTAFKALYNRDLIEDLKSETSGNFENLLVAMMTPLDVYYAQELYDAMGFLSTDKYILIEIMCTKSNKEIRDIKEAYLTKYDELLKDDLTYYTSGNFEKLMVSLSEANRDENTEADKTAAAIDAKKLYKAGEKRWGTDEEIFINIFTKKSKEQLKEIISQYLNLTNHKIEEVIESEFSGDVELGLQAIFKSTVNKAGYFAEQLYDSMHGLGTNDNDLIRLIVTRNKVEIEEIKKVFQQKYGESLESFISGDTSGYYEDCLLALIK